MKPDSFLEVLLRLQSEYRVIFMRQFSSNLPMKDLSDVLLQLPLSGTSAFSSNPPCGTPMTT
jgi:hypothetical protein